MKNVPVPGQGVYVYEFPVRLWHWTMAACIFCLFITGHFIGNPPQALLGDPTRIFYFGYLVRAHYIAAMILCLAMLCRIIWAFFGNAVSRQIFLPQIWKKSWWRELWGSIRWYLFLSKTPDVHMGHNPLAQTAMFICVLAIIYMCLTGLGIFQAKGGPEFCHIFSFMESWVYSLGGNGLDLVVMHRLGMVVLVAFVMAHVYMVVRESIMGRTTMISTMIMGYRLVRGEDSLTVAQYERESHDPDFS